MDLFYVTGNDLKVKLAKEVFGKFGINIIQKNIETPEIQSLDCEEVANYSSSYAAEKLNVPVLKNDSGLFIDFLDGFPGALAKYAENTIKAEGFIKLLDGVENRSCYWVEVLSYCEPLKEPISFVSISKGTISQSVCEGRGYDYDKIFIPLGDERTFSQMSEEEQIASFNQDAYLNLANYLIEKDFR